MPDGYDGTCYIHPIIDTYYHTCEIVPKSPAGAQFRQPAEPIDADRRRWGDAMHDSGCLARNLRGGAARLWERLFRLSADALLPRVWGPERVSEGGVLRNAVKNLPRQMGDDAACPGCIITGARAGCRMAVR